MVDLINRLHINQSPKVSDTGRGVKLAATEVDFLTSVSKPSFIKIACAVQDERVQSRHRRCQKGSAKSHGVSFS